ncbi:MAG: hypothetical protein WAO76_13860 [Georgfuchsia sp.]
MAKLRDVFQDQFEDRWRSPLRDFGRRISDSNADILIFMARKAACLYHCLEDLKLAHTSAICTSDLVLDGDLAWMKGKHVELVDDTIITGTTLYRARQRLIGADVASISTTAFCVDNDNWCRELVTPTEPYILADAHDVTSFSSQAVRAIGVIPRPYLIDFPLFGFIRIPGYSLDSVLSMTGWELDEVTSTSQRATGAESITMIPSATAVRALDQRLGWKCSELAQLIKVRLYSRRRGGRGDSHVHFCRALPIVAFDPLTIPQLQTLWQAFERNLGDRVRRLGVQLTTPKERLRLLQFFCATQLFYVWFESVSQACRPRSITFEIDFRQIDFCFPPLIRDEVVALLKDDTLQPFGGVPCFTEHQLPTRPGIVSATRFRGVDLPGIQAKLTEPFEALFTQREEPARELVKQHKAAAFELPEYRDLIDRLNQGISLPELRETISCLRNYEAAKTFVSMFIDDAIDRGIAVPITVDDGDFVYRAFRHGEDVKFTDVEARLACLMMIEVGRTLQLSLLPRLVVEKLIVLAIRGGLSRGWIDRWMGSLGDRKCAGIRFYLQGAVAQLSPDRRPYHYSPGDSLTSLLKGWGFLSEPERGEQYKVTPPKRPPTTTSMEKDAKALGAAIGLALKEVSAEQRDDELTLVATCLTPMDEAAALAAEINYFQSHWETLSNATFGHFHPNKAEEIIRTHEIYESVNSGLWKWRQYQSKSPIRVLADWHTRLEQDPSAIFADAVLEGAFPNSDTTLYSNALTELIRCEGAWMIRANIELRKLRSVLLAAFVQSLNEALSTVDLCEASLIEASHAKEPMAHITSAQFQLLLSGASNATSELSEMLDSYRTKAEIARGVRFGKLQVQLKQINHNVLNNPEGSPPAGPKDLLAIVRRVRTAIEAIISSNKKTATELNAQIDKLTSDQPLDPTRVWGTAVQLELPLGSALILEDHALSITQQALNELVLEGNIILDQVDAMVTPFGRPRDFHTYRHLLTVHISRSEGIEELIRDKISNAIRQIVIDAANSKNSADIFELQSPANTWNADVAVAGGGQFSREWLSKLAASIFNALDGLAYCRICLWVDLEPDETIIRAEKTTDVLARNLLRRIPCLGAAVPPPQNRDEVIILSSHGTTTVTATAEELSKHIVGTLRMSGIQSITLVDPHARDYAIDIVEKQSQAPTESVRADVGIITIVSEEMNATIQMLESSGQAEKTRRDGFIYYSGRMAADGGGAHFVVATQQVEQGNRSVILAYERLCREYQPTVIILLGIGGSIDPDTPLCDVVIADQVLWYEQATEKADGMQRKGEASKLTSWLRVLVNDFFAQKGNPYKIPQIDSASELSSAHLGPIGSGEKVIRFRESEIRKWLWTVNYKCKALETEAGGLAQAFYETSATTSFRAEGYMVIRGISDHADKEKDDKWRVVAARNACLVLKEFLATAPPFAKYRQEQPKGRFKNT